MAEYAITLYAPIDEVESEIPSNDGDVHDHHSEDLQHENVMIAAFALQSFTTATSIRKDLMTDGPFLESKEVVVGFCIVEAPDLDAALAIAQRNPILRQGGGVEVRPVEAWVIPTRTHTV
jgi:hypothetical protein